MTDFVWVKPATESNRVRVAVDEITEADGTKFQWPIYKIAYGAEGSITQVDENNPLPVKTHNHVEIAHEAGNLYQYDRWINNAATGNHDVLLVVPAGKTAHLFGFWATIENTPWHIYLYENTTYSATGAGVVMQNANRGFADAFSGNLYFGPTITAVGDQLKRTYVPTTTTGGGGMGGGGALGAEGGINDYGWSLPEGAYLMRFNNASGGTSDLNLEILIHDE